MRAGTMCAHLNFGNRPVHHLSNLCDRETFDIQQRQHQAILSAKTSEQLGSQVARDCGAFHVTEGARSLKLASEFLTFIITNIDKRLWRVGGPAPPRSITGVGGNL